MSYKILSLDGGGSWALIQARVLQDIYGNVRGHELLKKFDMAIANSGGALVLACLCNDMLLSDVIDIFQNAGKRKQVFSKLSFWEKFKLRNIASFTSILGPKYATERKLQGLTKILKEAELRRDPAKTSGFIVETYLNELPAIIGKPGLQLLIVGFDYFKKRASFFRSNAKSRTDLFNGGKFFQITLAHAIHSSSNAPVNYFDAPATVKVNQSDGSDNRTSWYWDGAVSGFNNPVLAGLIEAMTNNYKDPQEYCILSIGTGTGSRAVLTDLKDSTNAEMRGRYTANKNNDLTITDTSSDFFSDIKKMSTSILGDPPDSASFIAYSILDPSLENKANFVRINPCLDPVKDSAGIYQAPEVYKNPQDVKNFKILLEMDMDAVEDDQVSLITDLCDKFITSARPCIPNQLIRGNEPNYLGDLTYKSAKEKWLGCM